MYADASGFNPKIAAMTKHSVTVTKRVKVRNLLRPRSKNMNQAYLAQRQGVGLAGDNDTKGATQLAFPTRTPASCDDSLRTGAALRFSFLGPEGTFTYAALQQVSGNDSLSVPAVDVPSALHMVRNGDVDYAVVPIENSIEGGVNATIDSLVFPSPLEIKAEILVPITFALAVKPGTQLSDIKRIATHSHAWAQCRGWIRSNLGDVVHVPSTSTAAGAKLLSDSDSPGFEAALCPPATAQLLHLDSLSDEVADNRDAVTRFIMVGMPGRQPRPTGADKTTLMVQLPTDEAGALLNILEQFKAQGVNLSRIESRPVGDALGRYAFSIDAEGHIEDERMQAVLIGLHRICPHVTFLGSYPSSSGTVIKLKPGTANSDFESARSFVEGLLARS